jgi:hypothetical protein
LRSASSARASSSKRDDQPTLYDKGAFPAPGNPKVAVVKATSYDEGLQATVEGGSSRRCDVAARPCC